MKKSNASLTILGSILIFLTSVVVTYFGLLAIGVIDAKPIEITISINNETIILYTIFYLYSLIWIRIKFFV